MKIGIVLLGVVGFSVLCSQAVMIGNRQVAASNPNKPAGSVRMFTAGIEAVVVSDSGLPIPVAQHREELERYHKIEAQRAVENLSGKPLPHGTYTVPAGTKCEVLSQRGGLVEVMWIDGPMVQAGAWIHAESLKE